MILSSKYIVFYLPLQDAIPGSGQEADYASVDDALPAGKLHRIKSTSKKNEKS